MRSIVLLLAIAAAAVPLTAQVSLGGKTVPRDKFIVFLFMGHSNMDGFGESPDRSVDSSLWMWDITTTDTYRGDCPADPINEPSRDQGWRLSRDVGNGRPATRFLKNMKKLYPGYYLGVMQLSQWESIIPDKYLPGFCWYERMKHFAQAIKPSVTIQGAVLMLGWDDGCCSPLTNTTQFAQNVTTMMTRLRADLGLPGLPVIIGQQERAEDEKAGDAVQDVSHGCKGTCFPTMVSQTSSLRTLLTACDIVQSWGPYIDQHHFTQAGVNRWADSAAALLKRKNWGPATTTVQRTDQATVAHAATPARGLWTQLGARLDGVVIGEARHRARVVNLRGCLVRQ